MRHLQRPSERDRVGPIILISMQRGVINHFIAGDKSSPQFSSPGYYYACIACICSQHSFGLPFIRMSMKFIETNLITHIWIFSRHLESDHACFEHLSLETCAKYSVEVKACSSSIVVALSP